MPTKSEFLSLLLTAAEQTNPACLKQTCKIKKELA